MYNFFIFYFWLTLVELSKSASESIFKWGVRVYVASHNLIFFFNDENTLSARPDFLVLPLKSVLILLIHILDQSLI